MENPQEQTSLKHRLVVLLFVVTAIIIFGLLWLFFLSPSNPSGFGWFLFSFAAGLSMIVLPCTLPLAFVIVPLSMGKGIAKGLGIAIAFGLGITMSSRSTETSRQWSKTWQTKRYRHFWRVFSRVGVRVMISATLCRRILFIAGGDRLSIWLAWIFPFRLRKKKFGRVFC